MTTKTWTLIFMAAILVAIIVYDTVMATNGIKGDTISEITLRYAIKHPISIFCFGMGFGILFGHLFWPQYPTP
jgi:hypothetical protein